MPREPECPDSTGQSGSSSARKGRNQRGQKKATGPRTTRGRAIAALNSLRHGLTAERTLLPDEDIGEFEELRHRLWRALAPVGALEEALAERVVGIFWRLRRVVRVETELLVRAGAPARRQALLDAARSGIDTGPEHALAIAFLGAEGGLEQVGRHETRLERSLQRTLHELQRLQAARAGLPVLPPIAIDLEVLADDSQDGFVLQKDDVESEPQLLLPLASLADLKAFGSGGQG